MSDRRAVLTLYAFAASCGTIALLVRFLRTEAALLLIPAVALTVLFMGLHLGKLAVYEGGEHVPPESTIIQTIAESHYTRRVFEVLLDVVLIGLAYFASYVLRWEAELPPEQSLIFVQTVPLVIGVQLACFLACGLYRGLWRYIGVEDAPVIARSVFVAVVASSIPVFLLYGFWGGASRVVFVLDAILLLLLVGGSRLSFRLLRAALGDVAAAASANGRRPILIYGAGDGGEVLLREILNHNDYGYAPVGFIDDDVRKVGKQLHGLRIYHRDQLQTLIDQMRIAHVVVSTDKVSEARVEELRSAGISLRRMRILVE
jgi:UDP-GlcNAc:undecaprenyl-phosphate GlcNAc-1-phosphate transferase